MSVSRRDVLYAAGALGGVAALMGCEDAVSVLSKKFGGQTVPASVDLPDGAGIDPAHHLLARAGFGPWPGEVEHVRKLGDTAWIDQQLDPASIDDTACNIRAKLFDTVEADPDFCFEFDDADLRAEMARHTLLRAVYSKRQLFEVMVSFWTDHLNINIEKGDCIYLKPHDDRTVVRKHALGRFRDLIRASATSPAMLVYLDGKENARAKPQDIPNENYGRELLELHTLGVNGGYTQQDVYEVARCLTGWRVGEGFRKGKSYHDTDFHDNGEKKVLGHTIPAGQGGEKDLEQVIDIVCRHPSTAHYVSKKLVQRFVSEDQPKELVERVAKVFSDTDGQIKPMVRTILTSEEFKASAGKKFKPPFRFVASALRAVGADTHAHAPLIEYLTRMGQGVFQYPTPDGYPDEAAPWMGTLLWRWNLAFAIAGNAVPSVKVPLDKLIVAIGATSTSADVAERIFRYFAGGAPDAGQLAALANAAPSLGQTNGVPTDLVALAIASPAFQRY